MTEVKPIKPFKGLTRDQIINEAINKYTELNQLKDLARAVTIGHPKDRDDLVEVIKDIFEDRESTREELLDDVDEWFDIVAEWFYRQCDDLDSSGKFEIIKSLDGSRFTPKTREVVENVLRSRDNGGNKI